MHALGLAVRTILPARLQRELRSRQQQLVEETARNARAKVSSLACDMVGRAYFCNAAHSATLCGTRQPAVVVTFVTFLTIIADVSYMCMREGRSCVNSWQLHVPSSHAHAARTGSCTLAWVDAIAHAALGLNHSQQLRWRLASRHPAPRLIKKPVQSSPSQSRTFTSPNLMHSALNLT